MLPNIKSKIKDLEAKTRPPPPPSKPKHLSSSQQPQTTTQSPPKKRGLGWPWDHPAALFPIYSDPINTQRITWLFNWELWRPEGTPSTVEWVPCVRTAAQTKDIIPFLTDISTSLNIEIKHFLGFNEPEIPDQANLAVDEAVRLWRETVLPAKPKFGFRLGSPGMSSDVSRSKPWLNDFFAKLGDGHGMDFLVVHWYGPHFADMQRFLEDMYATYNLPLWVNEFACSQMGNGQVSVDQVEAFMREAVPWLDACPWIEQYAYFGHGHEWVGAANEFNEPAQGCEATGGKTLSRVGKLYTQL